MSTAFFTQFFKTLLFFGHGPSTSVHAAVEFFAAVEFLTLQLGAEARSWKSQEPQHQDPLVA